MNNSIKEIKFFRNHRNKLCMIIKYNDETTTTKKLSTKDKEILFMALTDITILNKYR